MNPQRKWVPHSWVLDPTTVSAQGERMGLQAPEGSMVWLPCRFSSVRQMNTSLCERGEALELYPARPSGQDGIRWEVSVVSHSCSLTYPKPLQHSDPNGKIIKELP